MGRLLDVRGAMDYLGLTEDQLRSMVKRRQIPFMKVGTALKFDVRTLDRWIESLHKAAS